MILAGTPLHAPATGMGMGGAGHYGAPAGGGGGMYGGMGANNMNNMYGAQPHQQQYGGMSGGMGGYYGAQQQQAGVYGMQGMQQSAYGMQQQPSAQQYGYYGAGTAVAAVNPYAAATVQQQYAAGTCILSNCYIFIVLCVVDLLLTVLFNCLYYLLSPPSYSSSTN